MTKKALLKAIKIAGGQAKLARLIGVSQGRMQNWVTRDQTAPAAEKVIDIEKATGVSRHELRPDIYPKEG